MRILTVVVLLIVGAADAAADESNGLIDDSVAVTTGAGTTAFAGKALRGVAGPGAQADARVQIGTRTRLSVELALLASAQPMDDGVLVGTAAEQLFRVNLTLQQRWQPYFGLGWGWRRYAMLGAHRMDVFGASQLVDVPLEGGISYRRRWLVAELRGTFRLSFPVDFLLPAGNLPDRGAMHSWGITARIGFEVPPS